MRAARSLVVTPIITKEVRVFPVFAFVYGHFQPILVPCLLRFGGLSWLSNTFSASVSLDCQYSDPKLVLLFVEQL